MTPMPEPTITAIIPTPGRGRPLARCLDSIAPQLHRGDEVIVVGDTHDGPLPEVAALVQSYRSLPIFYLAVDAGKHAWGHPQINAGIGMARGDYLTFNDDDDIYTPDAFSRIRAWAAHQHEPRPLLFRFRSYVGQTYWDVPGLVAQDHIGGHCAVFPNLAARLGKWTDRYQGDFDFIRSTLDRWPNGDADAVWVDEVIAVARPRTPVVAHRQMIGAFA